MKPVGNFKKGILNIGESPEMVDDEVGKPFQGKNGRILKRMFHMLGIDLFEDCLNVNAVNCLTIGEEGIDSAPTKYHVSCCRKSIDRLIHKYKPKVVILHGSAAVESIFGTRWHGKEIKSVNMWRGHTIPDRVYGAWVCPTFSLSQIATTDRKEMHIIWKQDLKNAVGMLDVPFPDYGDEEDCCEIRMDEEQYLQELLDNRPEYLAYDIETTGLKPYDTSIHRIVCISFCGDMEHSVCIPMPSTKKGLKLLRKVLTHPDIGKMAHNMKMEDTWMNVIAGIQTYPWVFDTMQATHVLDNRPNICRLKVQGFLNFGLIGYEDEIQPYLTSKDSNTPNRIFECWESVTLREQLMVYCAIDSLITYRLAMIQMKKMGVL